MKTLRIVLVGLALAAGLLPGAQAHGPRVGVSVQLGYPAYYVPPPVYYVPPPPPPVVYAPPLVYGPPVVVPPYRYSGYYDDGYGGPRHGWHGHHGHRGGHRHWR